MKVRAHSPELKARNAARREQVRIEAHRASILPPPRIDWSTRLRAPAVPSEYGFGYGRHVTTLALRAGIVLSLATDAHRATLMGGK